MNETLYSLDLQGLMLGRKILVLIESIKKSKSLIQVNIMNNLLSRLDELYIHETLGINTSRNLSKQNHFVSILEKYDMCY